MGLNNGCPISTPARWPRRAPPLHTPPPLLNSQLNKSIRTYMYAYAHYFRHTSTPTLVVRAELGAYPTYIPGIARLANYMSYLCSPDVPPLVSKAILVHKAIALTSKFAWWNNVWRILNHVTVTPDTIHHPPRQNSVALIVSGGSPKLSTFRQFHPSFHQAPFPQHRPPLPPPPSPTVSMFQPLPGH